jgi:hypothetical protein
MAVACTEVMGWLRRQWRWRPHLPVRVCWGRTCVALVIVIFVHAVINVLKRVEVWLGELDALHVWGCAHDTIASHNLSHDSMRDGTATSPSPNAKRFTQ